MSHAWNLCKYSLLLIRRRSPTKFAPSATFAGANLQDADCSHSIFHQDDGLLMQNTRQAMVESSEGDAVYATLLQKLDAKIKACFRALVISRLNAYPRRLYT